MAIIPQIDINSFDYPLPSKRIAQFPAKERDLSKMIVSRDGIISKAVFRDISGHLPENAHMIYNQTRVIHARLQFHKLSGAGIEIFCLEPLAPSTEMQQAFESKSPVVWKCLVGNSKRWKKDTLVMPLSSDKIEFMLYAERLEMQEGYSTIRFSWEPASLSFSEILYYAGTIPLPPYMDRKAEKQDTTRYQTIFAKHDGSVAAPTAGLHFTEHIFNKLDAKGIVRSNVTLHVGAGTFKPVSATEISRHEMHSEKIIISRNTIQKMMEKSGEPLISVGTTTLRTIESLYWHGVKLMTDKHAGSHIDIKQWEPYELAIHKHIPTKDVLEKLLVRMDREGLDEIAGQTKMMIVPGYEFKVGDILITNFHLPKSTLLLLVSAFIGDQWRLVYNYALNHHFRFLSYGDTCLLFGSQSSH